MSMREILIENLKHSRLRVSNYKRFRQQAAKFPDQYRLRYENNDKNAYPDIVLDKNVVGKWIEVNRIISLRKDLHRVV